jgi:Ser/Thr protein kinase RdoA (MazF antagonist)
VPSSAQPEITLPGGTANYGLVVRVGDTVRRPQRATSPATHALLRHLAERGFDGAPRLLGVDEQDREVLSYLPGVAPIEPRPEWALTEDALVSVARLLRRYHDAVDGFDATAHRWPAAAPERFQDGVVAHNDLNLDNVVFHRGVASALIDFDLAAPGGRAWDLAGLARLWVPLRTEDDILDSRRGRTLERFRLALDAYELTGAERHRVVDALVPCHDWIADVVRSGVARGNRAFVRYWLGGGEERSARTRSWFVANAGLLHDTV